MKELNIMRLILTIAMAFALAVTAQAHLTTELLAQAVLENLVGGGFSMQCSEDLGRVYQNQKVIGAMGKLSDDANQEGQLIGQTCAATAFPCITAFGQGTCCSVEGPQGEPLSYRFSRYRPPCRGVDLFPLTDQRTPFSCLSLEEALG